MQSLQVPQVDNHYR